MKLKLQILTFFFFSTLFNLNAKNLLLENKSGASFEGTFDAVVIGTPHDIYLKEGKLDAFLTKSDSLVVFDSHGVIGDDLRKKHNNHEFKIIGRGDV